MKDTRVIGTDDQLAAAIRLADAGTPVATAARDAGVTEGRLRRALAKRAASPTVTVAADIDELDAEIDRAVAIAERARAKGLRVGSINASTADREGSWDGFARDAGDDTAYSERLTAERHERKATVSFKLPDDEADRIELRQAQPIEMRPPVRSPGLTLHVPARWQSWVMSPDAQIGYRRDRHGAWHTMHDERCFDLGHQVARAVRDDDGLHGWIDPGDFADLGAASRWDSPPADVEAEALNRTWERGSHECAARRDAVGEDGEVIIMAGNHDDRLKKWAAKHAAWLVGMVRPGDETYPVLSVPFLVRAEDHRVEWVPGFPTAYRKLNSNLVVFHAPGYGSKAFATAQAIARQIHVSVAHGHTHRREATAFNVETSHGNRTMEVWSDGTWARVDGGLPSGKNAFDEHMDRIVAGDATDKTGVLSENMHQGMSVIRVEVGGRERFSVERIAFWDGWCQWRGSEFVAGCDVDGGALEVAA